MIYEQNCYNLNDNLIEIDIKNIPKKFIRFKYMKTFCIFLNYVNIIY